MILENQDPLAKHIVQTLQLGDVQALRLLLKMHHELAKARIKMTDGCSTDAGSLRSLLHVVTDWPGNFPNSPAVVAELIAAGADVNVRFIGAHRETSLHWAASCNDVAVLDALLDHGADIEADGGVIANGTPLADAVAFGQWQAARRLVERGAKTTLWQAAALGLMDRIEPAFTGARRPTAEETTNAFWCACHGGQREAAQFLLRQGAERDWIGYDGLTPLDAARRSQAEPVVEWLESIGARSAKATA